MSSLGINPALVCNPPKKSGFNKVRFNQISPFNHSLSIHRKSKAPQRICASTILSNPLTCSSHSDKAHNEAIFSENLDEWMRDSVAEIVKDLKQAPLLVQIYANNNGSSTEVKTEKANAEDWDDLKKEWISGDKPSPDGVILVEELSDTKDVDLESEDDETRAFGVLIQGKGKGKEYGPACYLLKTTRVGVGSGMGFFSTHFCLVRVKSFRETALSQFRDCWLVR